jgi:hypothetical protein
MRTITGLAATGLLVSASATLAANADSIWFGGPIITVNDLSLIHI